MGLVQKAFSDIITFSRSSNATRVGPTGLVEYAPHNLLVRSQEFDNVAWIKLNASVTANAATSPDGTVSADLLIPDTSSNQHGVYQTLGATAGVPYTQSIFAKAAGYNWLFMTEGNNVSAQASFNLATGVVGTVSGTGSPSATITALGNGWYRCTLTYTPIATSQNMQARAANADAGPTFAGNGTSGIYIWGAQLSVGPYALDYTPTTSAAVYGPRFDYNGSGVTIVEPVSRNLLTYSEQFDNAAWAAVGSGLVVTANTATAPDGTFTADTLTLALGYRLQEVVSLSSGSTYTFSVWAKTASGTIILGLAEANGSGNTTKTVTTSWQRFTFTFTALNSTLYVGFDQRVVGASTSGSVYLWGAQLEVGSTATGYMVSGATNGFRAVPVVSGSATARGLLVEESRTNLYAYSEQFNDASWTQFKVSITANAATAPDGTITADKVVENSETSAHVVYQTPTVSAVSYTLSVFAKAAERTQVVLDFTGSTNNAVFDLSAGTVVSFTGSGLTAAIQNFGNGWYRCSITQTQAAGVIFPSIGPASGGNRSYTGNGSSGIFIWGAQLEAGSFATSLIPTLASTVTRSADVASVNTLSPWFNATEGTLFVEADAITVTQPTGYLSAFNDGSSNELFGVYQADTAVGAIDIDGGSILANITRSTITANTAFKSAAAYKLNDIALTLNGSAVATDTSATLPTVTTLNLGGRNTGASPFSGHLRRIAYYPRRLTNAELQALTA